MRRNIFFRSVAGLLFLAVLTNQTLAGTLQQDSFRFNFNASLNLLFSYRSNPSFFCSFGINSVYWSPDVNWLTPNLGLSCNVYQGTIGTSVHPDHKNDVQIDLVGSIFASAGQARGKSYNFQDIAAYHAYAANFIENQYDRWSLNLGSSFILNNHKRNQHIGYFGFSVWDVSLLYYNDGGPIIHDLGLGGGLDRWWTGGLTLSVHPRDFDYRFSANYNVFTGYTPGVYEVIKVLKLKRVMYNDDEQIFFNNALLTVDVRHKSGFGFGVDMTSNKMMWLQNTIHTNIDSAHHPSLAPWRPDFRFFYDPMINLKHSP